MQHFDPRKWLAQWTDAGGGYAVGTDSPHLLRPVCPCAILDSLSHEIADPDRQEALAQHLKSGK